MQRRKEFFQFLFMLIINSGIVYGLVMLLIYLKPYAETLINEITQ